MVVVVLGVGKSRIPTRRRGRERFEEDSVELRKKQRAVGGKVSVRKRDAGWWRGGEGGSML